MAEEEALIRHALGRSLHSIQGAEARWEQRRATGLTDDELRAAIAAEWSVAVGYGGPDCAYDCQGTKNPQIRILGPWVGLERGGHVEVCRLSGARLLALVREVMGVGEPAPEGQMRLL